MVPDLAVGISENHGVENTEALEALTTEAIRRRAIELVTQAIARVGHIE